MVGLPPCLGQHSLKMVLLLLLCARKRAYTCQGGGVVSSLLPPFVGPGDLTQIGRLAWQGATIFIHQAVSLAGAFCFLSKIKNSEAISLHMTNSGTVILCFPGSRTVRNNFSVLLEIKLCFEDTHI